MHGTVWLYINSHFTLNLKTGVTKNTRYETVIPRAYQEMADHYDTAIVPARPKAPDDKPNAEGSVKFATTWILAAIRNYHFLSFEEAYATVKEKLEALNNKSFKTRGYTSALKAPVRCFGNHLSGKRKSWFRTDNECGGAAILKTRTSRMGTPVGC